MNILHYLEEKKNTIAENKLLKFVIVVLTIGLILNAFMTVMLFRRARTIVVPPVVNARFEISGKIMSDEYLRMMTRYVVGLALNYTPSSARTNFEELLTICDPTTYDEKKAEFYSLAETVETTKLTSHFLIQTMSVDDGKRQIEIQGPRKQLANGQKIKEGMETYTIDYSNNNGRFAIVKISQVLKQGE